MGARLQTRLLRCGIQGPPLRLSVCDLEPGAVTVRRAAAFPYRIDPERLLTSLQSCMQELPLLCGRLRDTAGGWREVVQSDAGLRYTLVDDDRPMPSYGYAHTMKPDLGRLTEPLSLRQVGHDRPIVGVCVTCFRDGTVIGLSNAHALMDGRGAWRLLERWSQHYRGCPDADLPTYDRTPLVVDAAADPSSPAEPPLTRLGLARFIAQSLLAARTRATALLHLPAALLAARKAELVASLPDGEWLSTQDIVMGHLVQALAAATDQPYLEIGAIYDLRRVPELGLAPGYIGNAATARALREPAAELARTPLHLAGALRRLAATVTAARARADLRARQAHFTPATALRHMPGFIRRQYSDGLLLNNYSQFPIYRVDFGAGPPAWGDYPRLPLGRVITVCPDPRGDGVAVHLTRPRAELRRLRPPAGAGPLYLVP